MALMLFDICFNKWMNIKNQLAQFISMIETNLCIYYVYKMRSLLWMKFNIKRRWLYSIIINEVWWFRVTSNFINNSMILKLIFIHGFQVFRAYKMKIKKQNLDVKPFELQNQELFFSNILYLFTLETANWNHFVPKYEWFHSVESNNSNIK